MPGGHTGLRLPAPRQALPSFRGEMALCRGLDLRPKFLPRSVESLV